MDSQKAPQAQETKLHFLDYWRIIRIRKTVILAVFLLVVLTATVVTFFLPEYFSSTARIKVERDQTDIAGVNQLQSPYLSYDPYFLQTEYELIVSDLILDKVIDDLKLPDKWAAKFGQTPNREETKKYLKGNLDARVERNTSLISIRYLSQDKEEAALIANTIAETYKNYRKDTRSKLSRGGIDALEGRLKELEATVVAAQSNVDYYRTNLNVTDTMGAENMSTPLLSTETLRRIEALRIERQAEYVGQKALLEKLKNVEPEKLPQVIPSAGIQDTRLISTLEQLTLAEQKLVSLKKEYGPEHTEVVKVSSQVEDLQTKIKDQVDGIILGLNSKVASLKEALDTMQSEVDKALQADLKKANETRPYWEAKRQLDEKLRFRLMLYTKIAQEQTDLQLPKTSMVEIVNKAVPGLKPDRPKKALNIALGVVIGLVVGVGLAFFIEYLDTSVKTIDDVERALGSPVLGVIPQNVGILIEEGAESPHAEAYRVLRTNLLFSRKDEKLNTVAVISAGAGEGKSTTVFNLAAVFAQSGQRILVVDSDLRRPTLHKMLKVTNHIGLTNYLLKQNSLEEVIQTTSLPTLDFMASGKLPSSSLGILSSNQMRSLITELKQHYDFVFFDSPPVMGVSDASVLASEVDMTLQVIQYRRYPQPMNIRAKQLIEKVGGNLVGIVLNNINMSQDESYYYYSGYYHDYYSRNEDQEPAAAEGEASGEKTKA